MRVSTELIHGRHSLIIWYVRSPALALLAQAAQDASNSSSLELAPVAMDGPEFASGIDLNGDGNPNTKVCAVSDVLLMFA